MTVRAIKAYVYRVTDVHGDESFDLVLDLGDWISVCGTDAQGKYQQFDSAESFHVYEWAKKHGFEVEMKEKLIEW